MPTESIDHHPEYYRELVRKRKIYRNKLITKGVIDGSTKMRKLMARKGL